MAGALLLSGHPVGHLSRRARRVRSGVAGALGIALVLGASPLPAAEAVGGFGASVGSGGPVGSGEPASRLEWARCGPLECTHLEVPLDDTVTGGPTIEIALARLPARGRRVGSLVVNPGGPGASGVDLVLHVARALPARVRNRFDVVGFDPRGVGASTRVDCGIDLDRFYRLDFDPDTPAERAALEAGGAAFAEACGQAGGSLLGFLATWRAARDLDHIRAALGDEQLTYLGYSYGTYLGTSYARQFPDRVRALVLDGAVDPGLDSTDVAVQQARGFERSLEAFLRWCDRRSRCAFAGDDAGAGYDALKRRADEGEVHSAGGRLNGTLFDLGVATLLYSGRPAWPALAAALDSVLGGSGTTLLGYADLYTGRGAGGTYDGTQESFFAISCLDGAPPGGVEGLRAQEDAAALVAPRLGRAVVNNSIPCAFWPVAGQPGEPGEPGAAPGELPDAPVLVLGSRGDPATPLAWARSLAGLYPQARLVVVDGYAHTSVAAGNACVDRLVARYLVVLELPSPGARC